MESQLVKDIKADMEHMDASLRSMEARGTSIQKHVNQLAEMENVDQAEVSKVVEDMKKLTGKFDKVNEQLKKFNVELKKPDNDAVADDQTKDP